MFLAEINAGAAHQGITKPTKIGTIVHFFGEYVDDVGFSANIFDRISTISNPFAICVLAIFNVAISFGGHIKTPLDTRIIVVVENSEIGSIVDRIHQGGEMGYHMWASTVKCKPIFVALISALQEPSKVRSCSSAFHKIGPPEHMTMAPLMLLNI